MKQNNFRSRIAATLRGAGKAFVLALLAGVAARADFQGSTHMTPFDEETINYGKTPANDCISKMQAEINAGKFSPAFEADTGYLKAVLRKLKIDTSSQVLVFSKTSFQRDRISPQNPRAIYFNDEAYIGFVPGSPVLEVTVQDAKLGSVFYTLEQTKAERPKFVRNDQCLECHASSKTLGVPGLTLRSFATDDDGIVDMNTGVSQITHRTPLEERWGGWYVTGREGGQTHRGNLVGKAAFAARAKSPEYLSNLGSVEQFYPKNLHLRPESDIVALMVLEHQSHLHNFITRMNFEAVVGLKLYGHVKYLRTMTEAFLKYILFTEEVPLTSPIKGNPEFTAWFESQGKTDSKGRSLRQFDLQTRLFKYPCSFLVYSEQFEKLPNEIKTVVYTRLWEILSGKDKSPDFANIPDETRRDLLQILSETKTDLPDCWRAKPGPVTLKTGG